MADQATLLGDPEFGAVAELPRLADVVQQRPRHQQIRVQARMQLADLTYEGADGNGVLHQSADVGVVPRSGAGGAAKFGSDRLGEQDAFHDPAEGLVVNLSGEVLEKALQLRGI